MPDLVQVLPSTAICSSTCDPPGVSMVISECESPAARSSAPVTGSVVPHEVTEPVTLAEKARSESAS